MSHSMYHNAVRLSRGLVTNFENSCYNHKGHVNMTRTVYELLGQRIRQVREKTGLSQEDVGRQLSMSPSGYGNYERGERSISLETLAKLAGIFGKPVEYLLALDSPLEEDEQELLHLYQGLPNAMKQLLLSTARLWHEESRRISDPRE